MPWLFAAVALVCAILFPAFRKVLIGVALLLVGVLIIFYISNESEEAASKKRIRINEVELADIALQRDGSGYTIVGRARNHSATYTLSDITLRVTLEDCFSDNACDVVFQGEPSSSLNLVPPGQARDFHVYVFGASNLRLKGKLRWNYTLVGTRGKS